MYVVYSICMSNNLTYMAIPMIYRIFIAACGGVHMHVCQQRAPSQRSFQEIKTQIQMKFFIRGVNV